MSELLCRGVEFVYGLIGWTVLTFRDLRRTLHGLGPHGLAPRCTQ